VFNWMAKDTLPDHQIIVVARDDDYTFGVLHSRVHEVWSLRLGGWLGVGNDPRYTPSTTFETFPFPKPTETQRDAVAIAAEALDELRQSRMAAEPGLTLTALYRTRPTWLTQRHAALDRAVLDAYGWPHDLTDDALLAKLLALNLARKAVGGSAPDENGGDEE
jgi:type II restriction/modification system DNA methylase subunit YeeA